MYKCEYALYRQVFSHWILLAGVVWGRPYLDPSSFTSCPEPAKLYTCSDGSADVLEWIVDPIVPENESIKFTSNDSINTSNMTSPFFAQILYIKRADSGVANMTISIKVTTAGLTNGTRITCRATQGMEHYTSYSTFHFADVPYHKNPAITYHPSDTYFTATLKLADMFDGGVPIDYYIIRVEDNAEIKVSGPTYALEIPNDTIRTVSVTAHNCAGNSNPMTLVLKYKQGDGGSDSSGSFPIVIPVAGGIGVLLLIVVLLVVICLCKMYRKCTRARTYNINTSAVFTQGPHCGLPPLANYPGTAHNQTMKMDYIDPYTRDPTLERPTSHYNMEENPVYTFKGKKDSEKIRKSIHIYETIEAVAK